MKLYITVGRFFIQLCNGGEKKKDFQEKSGHIIESGSESDVVL
jgi:hypothetical protein